MSVPCKVLCRLDDLLDVRQGLVLEGPCVGNRSVEGGHSAHGAVEPLERMFTNQGGDLSTRPAGPVVLVHDQDLPGLLGGLENRIEIEWRQRSRWKLSVRPRSGAKRVGTALCLRSRRGCSKGVRAGLGHKL